MQNEATVESCLLRCLDTQKAGKRDFGDFYYSELIVRIRNQNALMIDHLYVMPKAANVIFSEAIESISYISYSYTKTIRTAGH